MDCTDLAEDRNQWRAIVICHLSFIYSSMRSIEASTLDIEQVEHVNELLGSIK
jgi:hypothetical protein